MKIHKIKPRDLIRILRNEIPVLNDKEISDLEEVVEIISEIKYENKDAYLELFKKKYNITNIITSLSYNTLFGSSLAGTIYFAIVAGIGAGLLFSAPLIPSMLLSTIALDEILEEYKSAMKKNFATLKKDASEVDSLIQKEFISNFYKINLEFFKKCFEKCTGKDRCKCVKKIKESGFKNKECDDWLKENYPEYYSLLKGIENWKKI